MFEKKPSFVTESGAAVWAPDIEKIGDKYILYMLCLLWVNLHLPALELLLQILPKVPLIGYIC